MKSFLKWAAALILILWLVGKFTGGSSASSSSNQLESSNGGSTEESTSPKSGRKQHDDCSFCDGKGIVKLPDGYNTPCEHCSGTGWAN